MPDVFSPKITLFVSLAFGALFGVVVLVLSPVLGKNIVFVVAIPFAMFFLIIMFLDARWMMLTLLYTRALLDPLLNMTKLGEGAGMGAFLNLLVIFLVIMLALRFPGQIDYKSPIIRAWAVFLSICFLSLLYSPDRVRTFKLCINLCSYLAVTLMPFLIVKNEDQKRFWIKTLLYSSLAPVGLALVGLATHIEFFYSYGRLQGTFTHSNILAFYLVLIVAVVFYILKSGLFRLTFSQRVWLRLYMLGCLALLVVTETRSAWLSCVGMFFIYALIKERKFLFILLLVMGLLFLVPQVQVRLKDLSEGTGVTKSEKLNSMTWRIKLWESSVEAIKRRPIFGYGIGSFEQMSKEFFKLDKKGAPAHNVYLELMFELGLVGLLSYLAIYFTVLKAYFHRVSRRWQRLSYEASIIFAYTIGYLIVCSSDNTLYYLAFNWYFWFFMGLMLHSLSFEHLPAKTASA